MKDEAVYEERAVRAGETGYILKKEVWTGDGRVRRC